MYIHPKDMVDPGILTIVKHVDHHLALQMHMYIHPKDMADFVLLTIVKHVDDHS
jgi:hypothetical protein